jgi:hypothetical protein
MRRLRSLIIVCGICALSVAAAAQADSLARVPASSAPRAALADVICRKSLAADGRSLSVSAVMRPVKDTRHMQVLFDLLQAPVGGPFTAVAAPGLDTWLSPTNPPTLGQNPKDVWTINHKVEGLRVLDVYRFRVEFRWLGRKDRVLSSRALHTNNCTEPDLRPDVEVTAVTVVAPDPAHPKKYEYVTTLRNVGGSAAGPFQLQLSYSTLTGLSTFSRTIKHIGAHTTQTITQVAPPCEDGQAVEVSADWTEQANPDPSDTVSCPAPSATP